jgi:hypothetical protein
MDYLAALVRGEMVSSKNQQKNNNNNKIEEKDIQIASLKPYTQTHHDCGYCKRIFKCTGIIIGKPSWCCKCKLQEIVNSQLTMWCSLECYELEYDELSE